MCLKTQLNRLELKVCVRRSSLSCCFRAVSTKWIWPFWGFQSFWGLELYDEATVENILRNRVTKVTQIPDIIRCYWEFEVSCSKANLWETKYYWASTPLPFVPDALLARPTSAWGWLVVAAIPNPLQSMACPLGPCPCAFAPLFKSSFLNNCRTSSRHYWIPNLMLLWRCSW